MNSFTIPVSCSLVLTAVVAAGISHWWSVQKFTDLLENGIPTAPAILPETELAQPKASAKKLGTSEAVPRSFANSSKEQQEFFSALVDKMSQMETQNRDLLDQLAETNRDMMKMQFRLDTHSESFRPLPIGQEKPFSNNEHGTGIEDHPGVLPPRAEPLRLPTYE